MSFIRSEDKHHPRFGTRLSPDLQLETWEDLGRVSGRKKRQRTSNETSGVKALNRMGWAWFVLLLTYMNTTLNYIIHSFLSLTSFFSKIASWVGVLLHTPNHNS